MDLIENTKHTLNESNRSIPITDSLEEDEIPHIPATNLATADMSDMRLNI